MIDFLLEYVIGAACRTVKLCEEAKQCQVEVARIAIRTQNTLATLRDAQEQFERQAHVLEASLLELKEVFEDIHGLVGRCNLPSIPWREKVSRVVVPIGSNPTKEALINAEKKLERITQVGNLSERKKKHR